MNNQLAALIADSGRAPSAPAPALHDQFQLASLLGDARSADLSFGAKSEPLHEERYPAGAAYPCCLAARLNSLIRRGHRRFAHCDFRAACLEEFGRDPDHPAQELGFRGADFRGADLRGAHFVNCDFSRADLRGADLQDARFDQCDLTGVDFRGATTDGLTLIDCPADGADFRGTHWED